MAAFTATRYATRVESQFTLWDKQICFCWSISMGCSSSGSATQDRCVPYHWSQHELLPITSMILPMNLENQLSQDIKFQQVPASSTRVPLLICIQRLQNLVPWIMSLRRRWMPEASQKTHGRNQPLSKWRGRSQFRGPNLRDGTTSREKSSQGLSKTWEFGHRVGRWPFVQTLQCLLWRP